MMLPGDGAAVTPHRATFSALSASGVRCAADDAHSDAHALSYAHAIITNNTKKPETKISQLFLAYQQVCDQQHQQQQRQHRAIAHRRRHFAARRPLARNCVVSTLHELETEMCVHLDRVSRIHKASNHAPVGLSNTTNAVPSDVAGG
jgi:hypothetical protein